MARTDCNLNDGDLVAPSRSHNLTADSKVYLLNIDN